MNIARLALLLCLGLVSGVHIEDISDDTMSIYDPLDDDAGMYSEFDEVDEIETMPELFGLDDDQEAELSEDPGIEAIGPEEFVETEVPSANRLSCPFSGKNCRFKKAKCLCKTGDNQFKFTMKNFKPIESEEQAEAMESGQLTEPGQFGESGEQEVSEKEIVQEVPEVIEGFKLMENMNDPSQILTKQPDGSLQMVPKEPKTDYEDKTIRVRTEDKKDKNKKVHEYEYLRVKKVDKNGVKETHLESPKYENPSVIYHKGVIPPMDHSIKSQLASYFPPKIDSPPPQQYITIPQPTQPSAQDDDDMKSGGQRQIVLAHKPNPEEMMIVPYQPVLKTEQPQENPQPVQVKVENVVQSDGLTPKEKIEKKIAEIEQIKTDAQSELKQPIVLAQKPATEEMMVVPYQPVLKTEQTQAEPVPQVSQVVVKKPVKPVKFASISYPGSVTTVSSSPTEGTGASLRSLMSLKSKNKKSKKEKKLEKEKKKEMKKKKKLMKEYDEKKDLAALEKMKERQKILDQKLEKEKELLEKKQEASAVLAKRTKKLQQEKEKQERKIKMAEKRLKNKQSVEKKKEEKEKLKQIKKEKKLLKEQEKQLDEMKGDSVDDEEDTQTPILEKN